MTLPQRLRSQAALGALVALASLAACTQSLTLNLAPGDCLLLPGTDEIASVDTTDCAGDHHAEVVGTVPLSEMTLPPAAVLEARASKECTEKFESYIGVELKHSAMELMWLLPTESSWKTGDRAITCLAVAPDQQFLTQPLKDSGL